jgi:hypothetical protein
LNAKTNHLEVDHPDPPEGIIVCLVVVDRAPNDLQCRGDQPAEFADHMFILPTTAWRLYDGLGKASLLLVHACFLAVRCLSSPQRCMPSEARSSRLASCRQLYFTSMSSHQPDLRFRGLNPTFNFGMKIKSIRTTTICVPLGDKVFHSSQAGFPERNSCLVRIETDSGLIGWGEGGQHGPPQPVAASLNHVLGPKILGRDPTEPVRTWEELYSFSRDFGQKGTYIEALSAIDIALWDISGKALGVPTRQGATTPRSSTISWS